MSTQELSRLNREFAVSIAEALDEVDLLGGFLRTDASDIEQDEQDYNIPAWIEDPDGSTSVPMTITYHGVPA